MPYTSLRDFMKIGHQVRWLSWLALWLLTSYSLRLWTDDSLRQLAGTRR